MGNSELVSDKWKAELIELVKDLEEQVRRAAEIGQLTHMQVSIDYRKNMPGPELSTRVEISRTEAKTIYVENNQLKEKEAPND